GRNVSCWRPTACSVGARTPPSSSTRSREESSEACMPLGIRLRSRPSHTGILSRIARTPSGLRRDCARLAYPSNGPRGSESHRFSRLHIQNLDWRIAKCGLELRGRAIDDRIGPVVNRYDLLA